ncbi:hypothetical protein ACFX14_002399 [Malus domestica]
MPQHSNNIRGFLILTASLHLLPPTMASTLSEMFATPKQPLLKSGPVEKNLVVVSLVLMKRKPSSRSLCRRQYWNSLILSLVLTSLRPSTNSTTVVDNVKIEAHKQEEF